jgi:hypothetical protein
MQLEFAGQSFEKKKTSISNFLKILPVEDELFDTDGRKDMTKLTGAFGIFANAPKKVYTALFLVIFTAA